MTRSLATPLDGAPKLGGNDAQTDRCFRASPTTPTEAAGDALLCRAERDPDVKIETEVRCCGLSNRWLTLLLGRHPSVLEVIHVARTRCSNLGQVLSRYGSLMGCVIGIVWGVALLVASVSFAAGGWGVAFGVTTLGGAALIHRFLKSVSSTDGIADASVRGSLGHDSGSKNGQGDTDLVSVDDLLRGRRLTRLGGQGRGGR